MISNNFDKTIVQDETTGGTINLYVHSCGMKINILPRTGFSKRFAGIAIPFGSINNEFMNGDNKIILPAGTAHYMEHCIFSKDESGGLLSKLSSLGANANAYTSNTHTLYYFTSTENFSEILDVYMDAVLNPYLGEDRLHAEREIIIQELGMYKDDPDTRIYNELLKAMYRVHPVREDIGGTPDSVRQITTHHLESVRSKFYNPQKIYLTITGDVSDDEILEIAERHIDKYFQPGKADEFDYVFPEEDDEVCEIYTETAMDVAVESFIIGYKNKHVNAAHPLDGTDYLRNKRGGQLFWEMLIGRSSEIFESLFAAGLINDSFGYHYVCESTYSYLVAGGESDDPKRACDELGRMIEAALKKSPSADLGEEFDIQRRAAAGNFLRSLDSIEHSGLSEVAAALAGLNIFDLPRLYDNITLESIFNDMLFAADDNSVSHSFIVRKD